MVWKKNPNLKFLNFSGEKCLGQFFSLKFWYLPFFSLVFLTEPASRHFLLDWFLRHWKGLEDNSQDGKISLLVFQTPDQNFQQMHQGIAVNVLHWQHNPVKPPTSCFSSWPIALKESTTSPLDTQEITYDSTPDHFCLSCLLINKVRLTQINP